MTTQSPFGRYAVVQDKEAIENAIEAAIKTGHNVELDIYNENEAIHLSFRLRMTSHDHDDGSSFYQGTVPSLLDDAEPKTLNIHISKDGEVSALLSS